MRRSRSPASSYCTASGRDGSDWDVWAFRAKLHLRSGTPCLVLEFSMAQTGSVFARDAYLHQSQDIVANRAETTITLTDAPDDDERTVITDGLRAYNERRREVRTDVRSPSLSAILK